MYVFSLLPSTKAFWQSLSKQFNHNCLTSFLSFFNSLLARVDCFSIPVFLVFRVLRWRAFHNSRIKGCFPNKPWNVICIPYTMYQASTTLELQNIKDSFIIKVRLCAWAHSEDSTFWMVRSETSLHHSILFSHNFSFLHKILQSKCSQSSFGWLWNWNTKEIFRS